MLAQAKLSLPINSDFPELMTRFLAAALRSMNLYETIAATALNSIKTAMISINVKPFCFFERELAFTKLPIGILSFPFETLW